MHTLTYTPIHCFLFGEGWEISPSDLTLPSELCVSENCCCVDDVVACFLAYCHLSLLRNTIWCCICMYDNILYVQICELGERVVQKDMREACRGGSVDSAASVLGLLKKHMDS